MGNIGPRTDIMGRRMGSLERGGMSKFLEWLKKVLDKISKGESGKVQPA